MGSYKKVLFFKLYIIIMAKLHGFGRPMDPITEFDGDDEEDVPRQKPKYVRQLAMVDAESCTMQDPPVENKTKED